LSVELDENTLENERGNEEDQPDVIYIQHVWQMQREKECQYCPPGLSHQAKTKSFKRREQKK